MKNFEEVLDDAENETEWNNASKLKVTLEFLEEYCPEKLSEFQEFIQDKVEEELSM